MVAICTRVYKCANMAVFLGINKENSEFNIYFCFCQRTFSSAKPIYLFVFVNEFI